MKFIVENWFVIVAIAAVGGSIGYAIYSFVKMPSDKQLNKVREWLLYAVTKAEKELGAGTGKLKLSMCTTCLWQGLSGLQRSSHSTCSA